MDGVVRWRRKDLVHLISQERISEDETTVGRELKALGLAKLSARPRHHAQNELEVGAFKKKFPAALAAIRNSLPKATEIKLWWADETRIGQKQDHPPMGSPRYPTFSAVWFNGRCGRARPSYCPGATPIA
ncbi:helix-turn-helix domain-containing protein [Sinorhizobium medicae]|uniref:helix-turn-helix domain-containing protein n=1 Tax=Sinorhizobium medicae TaxID=110321 RepID=UPI000FDBFDF4|nr:hypothetical protein [Sinorhizobium medicae]MDX0827878.1 hypothetical protein [Sinorhizobium medicae]MDX1153207.1 hypothetical protein [Sinorhizobium medicae]PLU60735.1 hypothetical protein BMJ22_31730 [Sinorhizobium medicae]RVJ19589.1 winged helix-turn-helix domain-containing protein [Sinorhizobium medicae]